MAEEPPGFVAELWTILATAFLRPPAKARDLRPVVKIGFGLAFGLALLFLSFTFAVVMLDEVGRLDYDSGVTALIICGVAGLVGLVAPSVGPVSTYMTGDKRQPFVSLIGWVSILLAIAPFLESAAGFPTRNMARHASWFFIFFPAHFVVGGLLGLAVAISGTKLRWIWGLWGMFALALGGAMVMSFGA